MLLRSSSSNPASSAVSLAIILFVVYLILVPSGALGSGFSVGAGVAGFAILLGILGGPAGWGVALGGLAGAIFGAGLCAAN